MFSQEDSCADKFLLLLNRVDPDSSDDKDEYDGNLKCKQDNFRREFANVMKDWKEVPPVMAFSCLDVIRNKTRQHEAKKKGMSEKDQEEED